MHNGRASLLVLLPGDPHALEGRQGGQDGATDPGTVLALRRSDDLDLHGGWGQGCDLLLHPVSDAGEHGVTPGQDDVGVEVLPDLLVALRYRLVDRLVDAGRLHTKERRLEQGLWAPESLISNGDRLAIRKHVASVEAGALGSGLHLLLEALGHVAQLLLDTG